MLDRIKQDVVKIVLTVQVRSEQDVQAVEEAPAVSNVQYQHADYDAALGRGAATSARRGFAAVHARRPESRPQRSVPLRLGQEIQALPRRDLAGRREFRGAPADAACPGAQNSTESSSARRATMPVNYHPPTPEQLLPVAGVALGTAAGAHQELGAR